MWKSKEYKRVFTNLLNNKGSKDFLRGSMMNTTPLYVKKLKRGLNKG